MNNKLKYILIVLTMAFIIGGAVFSYYSYFKRVIVPVFTNNEPDTIINSLLQTLNDSFSDIEFLNPKKSSQWWINDDGWSAIDPNAVSINSITSTFKGEGFSVENLLNPLSEELNDLISKIFLDNGFTLNVPNTSGGEADNHFYDYVVAFQKDETRCTITIDGDSGGYSVACSSRFMEAYEEQITYLKALNERNSVVSVRERIGDFVWLDVRLRRTGYSALMQDKGEEAKLIFTGQESPYCDLMIENQVPKEVYKVCYDASGNIVE